MRLQSVSYSKIVNMIAGSARWLGNNALRAKQQELRNWSSYNNSTAKMTNSKSVLTIKVTVSSLKRWNPWSTFLFASTSRGSTGPSSCASCVTTLVAMLKKRRNAVTWIEPTTHADCANLATNERTMSKNFKSHAISAKIIRSKNRTSKKIVEKFMLPQDRSPSQSIFILNILFNFIH